MKDKFRTEEDGKAPYFEIPQRHTFRHLDLKSLVPYAVALVFASLLFLLYIRETELRSELGRLRTTIEDMNDPARQSRMLQQDIEHLKTELTEIKAELHKTSPNRTENPLGVSDVQTMLRLLEYYRDSVDGKMGGNTINAILEFQQAEGLSTTGDPARDIKDPTFLERLRAKVKAHEAENPE